MNLRLTVAAGLATVLASVSLYPLIMTGGWFWAGTGAVIVAAAVGMLTRRRPLPAILCLPAALAGEFLYFNAVFASGQSWGKLIPTVSSVRYLGTLVSQATHEMSAYAPPVPGMHGIVLYTAAGVGIVGAITDLLAVRLRRPALAGLPLLLLFCTPLLFPSIKPGWIATTLVFSAGMGGYLGLLSADGRDRLRLWGRLVHPWHSDSPGMGPDTRPLAVTGRRIGAMAVILALFLPVLVPGLRQHKLFSGSGHGGPHGYHGPISLPDPLADLNQQLHESRAQTVLTYRTTDPQPPYLQVYVLGRLDVHAWTLAPPAGTTPLAKGNMPPVPGLLTGTPAITMHESISLSSGLRSGRNNVSYLPLPYAARTIQVSGSNWRVDHGSLTVLGADTQLGGLRYSVTSKDVNPSQQQLREAPATPGAMLGYLAVPAPFERLTRLVEHITKARTSAYGKAIALQDWFTRPGNFTYSLKVAQTKSPQALANFLTRSKRGYCQQFAFAMAVLARLVHIPSRVVVGYTQGSYVQNNTWQVKTSDAHAWPELYFTGAGWLRFEPTPVGLPGQPGQETATAPAYTVSPLITSPTVPGSTAPAQNTATALPTSSPTSTEILGKVGNNPAGGAFGPSGHKQGSSRPVLLAALLVALGLALIIPRAVRSLSRHWRWWKAADDAARAHAAWQETRDIFTDHRIACRPSESPRAIAGRLAKTLDFAEAEREALERLARAEERASYAAAPAGSGELRSDVATVRHAVTHSSPLTARWSALLMPASALVPLRAGLQHLMDVFGWLDVIMPNLRRDRPGKPQPDSVAILSWRG